jgi:hypothetical protein
MLCINAFLVAKLLCCEHIKNNTSAQVCSVTGSLVLAFVKINHYLEQQRSKLSDLKIIRFSLRIEIKKLNNLHNR